MANTRSAHPANRKKTNLRFNEAKNKWEYNVRLVRPDGSVFRRSGSASLEADAKAKRDQAYDEFNRDQGEAKEAARKQKREKTDTLSNLADRALGIIKDDAAPTTYEAYRHALRNHVLPVLGSQSVSDLRASVIQELLNELVNTKGMSVASQSRSALSRVLDIAVMDDHLQFNPVKSTVISRRKRKTQRVARAKSGASAKRILSQDEVQTLLDHCRGKAIYWPILLGVRFGLRIGEAIGLPWSDVDLKARELHVTQQAQYTKATGTQIMDPKSEAGVRVIPIPIDLLQEFADAKAAAAKCGNSFVCVDDHGNPYHPKHVSRNIKAAVIAAGFNGEDGKRVPTFHRFRASCLTILANYANDGAGMKPQELSDIAGHADWQTTMQFYIEPANESVRTAIDSLRSA